MRKQPIAPPQAIVPKQLDTVVTQVREYRLITPLYGGGVTPNEADPVTVVRATEVRGHLRFWWRACRGGMFDGNAEEMWKKENEIWGKAHKKGDPVVKQAQTIQIIVDVDPAKKGKPIKPFVITEKRRPQSTNGIPGYAAFPLQPDQDKLKEPDPYIPDLWKDVSFILTILFPEDQRKEVEAALWAWETFGGIGGRTRRGFGALHLLAIDGKPCGVLPVYDVERWIREKLNLHVECGNFPDNFPHLSRNIQLVVTTPTYDPMVTWQDLITRLQKFRQYRDARRRAIWPEAKAIRSLLRNEAHSYLQKFPRAAFGLPIIFHFTGANAPTDNITLKEQGENKKEESKERFASPLILRPFLCNDNRAVGLALLLEGSRVDLGHLVLEVQEKQRAQNKTLHSVQGTLTKPEARNIDILKGETDVLQAFMQSFKGVR
jgi:CRISPR-associated protein Cmr1